MHVLAFRLDRVVLRSQDESHFSHLATKNILHCNRPPPANMKRVKRHMTFGHTEEPTVPTRFFFLVFIRCFEHLWLGMYPLHTPRLSSYD